jgi:phage terminase large subunit
MQQLSPVAAGKRVNQFWGELWPEIEQRFGPAGEKRDQAAERWDELEIPPKLEFLREPWRYKVAYGGRGGMKSWSFARALLWLAKAKRLRVLCAREYQNSIQESVHRLLSDQIQLLGFGEFFKIQQLSITGVNGSEFIFKGIKNNPQTIKSMEGVDICWLEEAQTNSEYSWQILIPTIRKAGSEIWVSFNPDEPTDPTYKRLILNPPPGAVVQKINWQDNPFFPEELRKEKDYQAAVDLDAYFHIWEGECRKNSAAQILAGKCRVEYFVPLDDWHGPYFGSDWGFAQDPTTLVKCWIGIEGSSQKLYIEQEVYRIGLELDHIKAAFESVDGAGRHTIRADNARPETISYLRRQGLNIVGAPKGKGSVEDGIAFLRGFEQIIIHPECIHTAEESRMYSYKTDRLTGDVLPLIVDAHNHCIDALRYALEPVIKASPGARLDWS